MCLLVFAWDSHPRYRFVFVGNRDEFHARPAAAAQWWKQQKMLAGRDEQAGGSWLGVRRDGRFSVVTNFREMNRARNDLRSRGELIPAFMMTDGDFVTELSERAQLYSGYNLILGDLSAGALHYHSNRGESGTIEPGLHGLSNHHLDTPWPKVSRAMAGLQEFVAAPTIEADSLLDLLADRQQAPASELPDTGIGPKWEQLLSSAFIVSPDYGTRCTTAVLLDRNGLLTFVERRFNRDGENSGESRFEFQTG